MSDELLGAYTFLPWVQQGLARSIPVTDDPGGGLAGRVTLPVTVQVEGAGDVRMDVRLHGPGDVTGLDPRQILHTDPRPGATSFEASYLAAVAVRRADLPWLFTPGDRRARTGVCALARPGRRAPAGRRPARPRPRRRRCPCSRSPRPRAPPTSCRTSRSLGRGRTRRSRASPPASARARSCATAPAAASSRLLCPRRLEPRRPYLACVVPAFALGVRPVSACRSPAATRRTSRRRGRWTRLPTRCGCPSTTPGSSRPALPGSFETLVRRLHAAALLDPRRRSPRSSTSPTPAAACRPLDPATPGAVVEHGERAARARARRPAALARRHARPVPGGAAGGC